ncbi:MAG: M15 family metallopeptidase [Paludibacteraceae bacterium]|nr:M15 family metallopeptidase [Paludibacteraceae bacterium]
MKHLQHTLILLVAAVTLLTGCQCQTALKPEEDSSGFVNITDVVPDAILEIRYYSTYNFVGTRVDGYLQPTALMTREAADSLKAASDELLLQGYRIKIYDAYRPQCAVDHFVRWAENIGDTLTRQAFYPDVDKSLLFEQEYIMKRSGHTRGSTVDLTLVNALTGREVDMGGVFDWFGGESHPDYCGNPDERTWTPTPGGLTEEQFFNRLILREAMLRHGFKPLDSEWWHFTLANEPYPDTYFTFPVQQLQ